MWSEEKIRNALAVKKERLAELTTEAKDLSEWVRGGTFMDEPEFAKNMLAELAEVRRKQTKIENQIEVMKCILDIQE